MLDKLPTELLLRTLELAAPLDYTPSSYLERRPLLLSCSLVSKQICAIAQPMLLEVYEISEPEHIETLEAIVSGEKRGSKVKVLTLYNMTAYDTKTDSYTDYVTLAQLVALCPALSDLRLSSEGGTRFDLGMLATLAALRHLVVFGATLCVFAEPNAVFESLLELSIVDATVEPEVFSTFPSAHQTPALQALGVAGDSGANLLWQRGTWATLDIVELMIPSNAGGGTPSVQDSTLSVYEQDLGKSTLPPTLPLALRFYVVDFNSAKGSTEAATLRELIRKLDDLPPLPSDTSLRYLSLPLPLRHSSTLHSLVEDLSRVCTIKGVELYWDAAPEWGCESTVSPALWTRARELRRERERRDEGVGPTRTDEGRALMA